MFWRSKNILDRPENSQIRALYKSMGYTDDDLQRPMIGIANSWNDIVPGHINLKDVSRAVKKGIIRAGGNPVEFGVIAACDGVANGNQGMHYILPTREVISNSIEMVVQAHSLDGLVLLGSCDKIVPGMLMAAARINIPTIMVPGGPMEGGMYFDNRKSDVSTMTEALGMLKADKITDEEYKELENRTAPGCGSCAFLGTANTMCCVAEALGMTLPYGATAPATSAERLRIAQMSGKAIMKLVEKEITARDIINEESIKNAIKVSTAIAGSTNVILHILAIAYEAGADISIDLFDKFNRFTPQIAKIFPSGSANVPDFHKAGGIPAVMKEISELINLNTLTVTTENIENNINSAEITNRDVITSLEEPFSDEGGLAVLKGNLAPATGVTKPAAIDSSMLKFKGKARVFNSEEEANSAISTGRIKKGDVVVIRYEGPKGGPGMREMYKPLKLLYGMGLALKTAVVTDGRFSGTNNGCFVGHVSPEAAEGGPLAVVKDGDLITIDVPNRNLKLHVSDEEIKSRMEKWQIPELKIKNSYLSLYARLAESANMGGIIKHD